MAPVTKKPATPAKVAAPVKAEKVAEKPAAVPTKVDKPVETTADVVPVSTIEQLAAKLVALTTAVKDAQIVLKALTKEHAALVKLQQKVEKKRSVARSAPSGFAKPSKITAELAEFMGLAKDAEASRTDITRFITGYVRTHDLNDPKNRRLINPDAKMKKLFKLSANEQISYFQLQRLITPFIVKA